jgi:hypothetical protein
MLCDKLLADRYQLSGGKLTMCWFFLIFDAESIFAEILLLNIALFLS